MPNVHKIVDIRRNDTVRVITGRDKGKEGRVLRVILPAVPEKPAIWLCM